MVSGVDVWMNTPVPLMEASGTSGMKAGMNGVLNFSVLDGWWIEGYNGRNGWAFEGHAPYWGNNRADANTLYDIIENGCLGNLSPPAAVPPAIVPVGGGEPRPPPGLHLPL